MPKEAVVLFFVLVAGFSGYKTIRGILYDSPWLLIWAPVALASGYAVAVCASAR